MNHRRHEIAENSHRPDLAGGNLRLQLAHNLIPDVCREIDPAGGRAFLPLTIKPAAHHAGDRCVDVVGRMGKDVNLATSLPNDPGIVTIAGNVIADIAP